MEASRQATSRGTSDSYLKSTLIRLAYYVAGPKVNQSLTRAISLKVSQADMELALPLSHA